MQDTSHTHVDDNDHWVKLFQYLDQRFGAVDARFDEMQRQFSQLQSVVDGLAADVSTLKDEGIVRDHQLDERLERHEGWIRQLADHSQVKLESQA